MVIYSDDHAERGLRSYVEAVARGLGVEAAASVCEWSPPANAYIALTERLPSFPTRDFALVWDERHGWAAMMETYSGEDMIVLGYLLGDVLPPPAAVVEFARATLTEHYPRCPAEAPVYDRSTLPDRLALYAAMATIDWVPVGSGTRSVRSTRRVGAGTREPKRSA